VSDPLHTRRFRRLWMFDDRGICVALGSAAARIRTRNLLIASSASCVIIIIIIILYCAQSSTIIITYFYLLFFTYNYLCYLVFICMFASLLAGLL